MVSDRSGGTVGDVNKVIAQWNALGVYRIINVGPVCPNKYRPHYCITLYRTNTLAPRKGTTNLHVFARKHILAADIYINPSTIYASPSVTALLSHEVGHGLGLLHRPTGTLSIMQTPTSPKYFPDLHDKQQLRLNRHLTAPND